MNNYFFFLIFYLFFRELFRKQAQEVDFIVTTALIPGKPAPKLILKDMVELMKPGSVIVDLAAEAGPSFSFFSPHSILLIHFFLLKNSNRWKL